MGDTDIQVIVKFPHVTGIYPLPSHVITSVQLHTYYRWDGSHPQN